MTDTTAAAPTALDATASDSTASDAATVEAALGTSRRDALKLGGAVALGGVAATMLAAGPAAAVGQPPGDGFTSNRFSFEIDGVIVAGVHTIDGIEQESDVVEYRDGDPNRKPRPRPGKVRVTRDFDGTTDFANWFQTTLTGTLSRRSLSVIFHNDAGEETGRINFFNAYPVRWTGPSLDAAMSGHPTEALDLRWLTLEIKHG